MATQVQLRRGTGAWHQNFTGAAGETTVNTTDFSLHVHDGVTPGGHKLQSSQDGVASFKSRTGPVAPQAGDYSAAQVSVAPAGGLAATDVQAALVELDSEASTVQKQVAAIEGKAGVVIEKLKTFDALNTKVTALSGQVAAMQKQTGVSSFKSRTGAVAPQAGDYSAAQVSVAPAGGLAASDVQAALVELDSEATALNAKVTAVENKAVDAAEKLKTLDALEKKLTEVQTKGAGVASFKGRTGAIVPQAGDYSANWVGFTPTGELKSYDVQSALAEIDARAASSRLATTIRTSSPIGTMPAAGQRDTRIPVTDVETVLSHLHRTKISYPEYLEEKEAFEDDFLPFQRSTGETSKVSVKNLFSKRMIRGYTEAVEVVRGVSEKYEVNYSPKIGNVKHLTLTGDAFILLPSGSNMRHAITTGSMAEAFSLTIILKQDAKGGWAASFGDASGTDTILWDSGGIQPSIATGPNQETMFSFYLLNFNGGDIPRWKAARVHKEG